MTLRTICTRWPVTIRVQDTLATAIDRLCHDGFRHLPVLRQDGRPAGMLSDRDAMLAVGWHRGRTQPRFVQQAARTRLVGQFMSTPLVGLQQSAGLADACNEMLTHRISSLAVLDGDDLQGLVTTGDLFEAYARLGAPGSNTHTLSEVMQSSVITATRDTNMSELIRIMEAERIRHIPIMEGEIPVGMVSDRDLLWSFGRMLLSQADQEQALQDVRAADIMSKHLGTIARSGPILLAAVRMVAHQISALPVMDEGRMVGIITGTDVLALMHQAFRGLPLDTPFNRSASA